ncbi:MAG: MATE family efflux transporter [Treponema sp.]
MVAAPITVQNFINSAVNMADAVMIGRLGETSITAVGLGNQIFFLLNLLLFGLVSGSVVFSSQFWGRKDVLGIQKTIGLCFIIATIIGGIFTFFCLLCPEFLIGIYSKDEKVIELGASYLKYVCFCFFPFVYSFSITMTLRSIGKIKLAVITTAIGLVVNITLNMLLIFGLLGFPALGVRGAAIATVISRFLEFIIVLSVSIICKYPVIGSFRNMFSISLPFLRDYFMVALPVVVEETIWSFGVTTHNLIFARLGTSQYAAFNIVNTVSLLLWVIFLGLGNGSAIIIGNKIGEGKSEEARDYAKFIALLSPLLAIFIILFFIPISILIPYIFNVTEDVLSLIPSLLVVLSIYYPLKAYNSVMIVGICRGGGDTRFSLFYDVFFMWVVAIPIAYTISLTSFSYVWLIYALIMAEEPLKMILGLTRLKSGKWLHCVI